ncbi:MAG: choice-of-anchor Q domain-containing protein [Solirubrobacterales bacterium]
MSSARILIAVASAAAVLGLTLVQASTTAASVITVTTSADEDTPDGDCSLREAVKSANLGAADACVQGATTGDGGDSIVFASGINMVTLSLGALEVLDGQDLSINGPFGLGESPLVIDAGGANRIFDVGQAGLTISRLVLRDGAPPSGAGGAIRGGSSVAVSYATLLNNDAEAGGAISTNGSVAVFISRLSGNSAGGVGGAIALEGDRPLWVSGSEFTDNAATAGGALSIAAGSFDVSSSLFAGNVAGTGAGMSVAGGDGGGVANSTFTGNTATPGAGSIEVAGAPIDVSLSTFAENASPTADIVNLDAIPQITLRQSIVASPIQGAGCSGPIGDGGYNVIFDAGPGSCPVGGTNLTGDPVLGPLADNGGYNRTRLLGPGSAAIDVIPFASRAHFRDQRDGIRPTPYGLGSDVGAVEVDYLPDATIGGESGLHLGASVFNEDGRHQTYRTELRPARTVYYEARVYNRARLLDDQFQIKAEPRDRPGFRVTYFRDHLDVTSEITSDAGILTPSVRPAHVAERVFVAVRIRRDTPEGRKIDLPITARSTGLPKRADTVRLVVEAK